MNNSAPSKYKIAQTNGQEVKLVNLMPLNLILELTDGKIIHFKRNPNLIKSQAA